MLTPIALGLIQTGRYATTKERTRLRIEIGSYAGGEGYALVEVFELAGDTVHDEAALTALKDLAVRSGARTLLTTGHIPRSHLTQLVSTIEVQAVSANRPTAARTGGPRDA